ncbi:MAG: hypothetical protein AB1469_00535 [Pseudomonadota bacterium]
MKRNIGLTLLLLTLSNAAYALDSYRYLHVSIDTLWKIFLFLLVGVLVPFACLAWLYWRHAQRTRAAQHRDDA